MPTTIAPLPSQTKVPPGNREQPRLLRWLVHCGAAVVLTVVMFAAVELIFAMAGVGEDTVISPDPLLGYFLIPDKAVTFRSEGFSRSHTNSSGFRDKEYSVQKPAGTTRIAVLGDSVTLGFEVPPDKTFPKLLEQKFQAKGKRVEVLNCGMSGSGTGQQYLLFRQKIAALQPDVLVLAYHAGDTDDNVCGGTTPPRPVFSVNDRGELKTDFSDVDKWLQSEQSRFYASLDQWRSHSRIWSVVSRARQDMVADSTGKLLNTALNKPSTFIWNSFLGMLPAGKWDLSSRQVAQTAVVRAPTTPPPLDKSSNSAHESAKPGAHALACSERVPIHRNEARASAFARGAQAPLPAPARLAPVSRGADCQSAHALAPRIMPRHVDRGAARPVSFTNAKVASPVQTSSLRPEGYAPPNAVPADNGRIDVDLLKGYLAIGKARTAVTKTLLTNLNKDCASINCKLILLELPAFDNDVRYYRELQEIEDLSKISGFECVPGWRWFPARPPMGQSKYFFDLHFNRAGHQLVCDGLWKVLGPAINQP